MGGVTLCWENLSVYASNRDRERTCVRLVHDVRGAAKPGELTAILGASGAGKSSLMCALAFRGEPGIVVRGDVRANGRSVDSSYMSRHSGFMHQEDLFVESMSVIEHLWFMARMKLDRRTPAAEVSEKIDRSLREVGLTGRCDARIGGGTNGKVLSGGEKKRLAFATELLTDPTVLFLDEPTTGQDSYTASLLVSRLSSFVAGGRTVLCTIHQPNSTTFGSFHRIILIADGRVAFTGSTERAIEFFASQGHVCPKNYNPADFFLAILSRRSGEDGSSKGAAERICKAFFASGASKEIEAILETEIRSVDHSEATKGILHRLFDYFVSVLLGCCSKEPRYCTRVYWLVRRGFMQVLRDPSVQIVRILQKASVATVGGLCFVGAINPDQLGIQAVQGAIFILVSENAFFPMYATLALIPQELPLLRREYRSGMYSIDMYYVARTVSLVPGLILEPVLFTAILYWLAGLRSAPDAFALSLLVVVLTMNISAACGCFFSVMFDSVPLAMAYLVPFDYVLMITMGPFVKLGSLPIYVRWVRYVSWLLHSYEALTILQWRGVANVSCESVDPELPCISTGGQVLSSYDFEEENLWMDILLMLLVYLLFHLLGCTCLWHRCRTT